MRRGLVDGPADAVCGLTSAANRPTKVLDGAADAASRPTDAVDAVAVDAMADAVVSHRPYPRRRSAGRTPPRSGT